MIKRNQMLMLIIFNAKNKNVTYYKFDRESSQKINRRSTK